jgi:hypothetical protein
LEDPDADHECNSGTDRCYPDEVEHRDKPMKMSLLFALAGLAICFAVPVLAQEKNTVDPEVRQQIEAVMMRFDDAYNKSDAAAIAALFTQDAVEAWGVGEES